VLDEVVHFLRELSGIELPVAGATIALHQAARAAKQHAAITEDRERTRTRRTLAQEGAETLQLPAAGHVVRPEQAAAPVDVARDRDRRVARWEHDLDELLDRSCRCPLRAKHHEVEDGQAAGDPGAKLGA
jgi:hypothetical protein